MAYIDQRQSGDRSQEQMRKWYKKSQTPRPFSLPAVRPQHHYLCSLFSTQTPYRKVPRTEVFVSPTDHVVIAQSTRYSVPAAGGGAHSGKWRNRPRCVRHDHDGTCVVTILTPNLLMRVHVRYAGNRVDAVYCKSLAIASTHQCKLLHMLRSCLMCMLLETTDKLSTADGPVTHSGDERTG